MQNNQSNLLSFLNKQALFNNSPSKNSRRRSSRSHSKDRSHDGSSANYKNWVQDTTTTKNILDQLSGQKVQNSPQKPTFTQSYYGGKVSQPEQPSAQKTFWPSLVSYPTSFQGARREALQILEKLSGQLKVQIKGMSVKIQSFTSQMEKVVSVEFKNFRQRLMKVIEQVYKESQKYVREYVKSQEDKLAKDVILMRDFMQKELDHIEKMKSQIRKQQTWRKPTAEIVGTQFQQKMNDVINKSHELYIGKWDSTEINGYRLKDFERNLTDLLKLRR